MNHELITSTQNPRIKRLVALLGVASKEAAAFQACKIPR